MASAPRLFAFLLALTPAIIFAASPTPSILVLKNGDRITGHEVKREDGLIHFQSDLLGLLKVPVDQATIEPISTKKDLELQLATTEAPSAGFPDQSAKQKTIEVSSSRETKLPPHGPPAQEPIMEEISLNRQLEFGLTSQTGRRDRRDVSIRATIERISKSGEVRLHGRYLYGDSNDQTVTDNLSGNFRYRRNLAPDFFAQAETKYEKDPIKGIRHNFSQSLGMGRNLLERESMKIAFGGGTAARFRDADGDPKRWTYLVDAFQDFVYSINSHFKLTQDMSVLVAPFDESDFLLKLNAALTSKLTNTLNMSMRYEFEYDSTLVPDARRSQRVVTSVGYAF